eukprot:7353295-Lingulodinium_polyedra.AAC.1
MPCWRILPEPARAGPPGAAGPRGGDCTGCPTAGAWGAAGRAIGPRCPGGGRGVSYAQALAPTRCRTEVAECPM